MYPGRICNIYCNIYEYIYIYTYIIRLKLTLILLVAWLGLIKLAKKQLSDEHSVPLNNGINIIIIL